MGAPVMRPRRALAAAWLAALLLLAAPARAGLTAECAAVAPVW